MSTTLTLMGAGGKMGLRITDRVKDDSTYEVAYVEPADSGQEALAERGIEDTATAEEAIPRSDIVVMAVPDDRIGPVAETVAPKMDSGAMMVLLDPAAAFADVLPDRGDITYFITHPCHPSFFTAETSMNDDDPDWFGGQGRDEQHIVCALHAGPEEEYARGEAVARDIYAPVRDAYRLSTEQMAILEPALAETLAATCIDVIREGFDHAVEMGVPEDAARAFLFGHLRIDLGIVFGFADFPFSDGAQEAIDQAKRDLFREDWKRRVFDRDNVRKSALDIATTDG